MFFLVETVANVQFENEILQFGALICSLLTNISLSVIHLVGQERRESISRLNIKIKDSKIQGQKLAKCVDKLGSIQVICEATENSNQFFSSSADKKEMVSYYQEIISQIHDHTKKALQDEDDNLKLGLD